MPLLFYMQSLCFWFGLFALLLASTGNLVPRAVTLGAIVKELDNNVTSTTMQYVIALYVALVLILLTYRFVSCL